MLKSTSVPPCAAVKTLLDVLGVCRANSIVTFNGPDQLAVRWSSLDSIRGYGITERVIRPAAGVVAMVPIRAALGKERSDGPL
jgi:hypothetical protein